MKLNLSFRTIDNSQFCKLLEILRSKITFMSRIKPSKMVLSNYNQVHEKIKKDVKDVLRIFIILNA